MRRDPVLGREDKYWVLPLHSGALYVCMYVCVCMYVVYYVYTHAHTHHTPSRHNT